MGARVYKTGIAVTLASAICLYLDIPVIFAALSAVINMKPSIIQSWKNAWEQVAVHLIGVMIAFAIGLTFGTKPNALTMGLATVLVIWLCGRLSLAGSSMMGVLTALFILTAAPQDFVPHAIVRTQSIFVGLLTAPAINFLIWPPRYGEKLRAVLQIIAEQVVSDFADTIARFVQLNPLSEQEVLLKQEKLKQLMNSAEDLLGRYREQTGKVKPKRNKPSNNPDLLEGYYNYLQGLFEKTVDLTEVITQRVTRRERAGNQPLSPEFMEVLNLVTHGTETVVHLNQLLQQAIFAEGVERPEATTHRYWDELAQVIESWHGKFSGSYYLHALVEVGVVIREIKWASDKARDLFKEIQ